MSYQREFEKRLNVAIVGVGSHGYRNILPTLTFLPIRLKALCDLDMDPRPRHCRTVRRSGVLSEYGRDVSERRTGRDLSLRTATPAP